MRNKIIALMAVIPLIVMFTIMTLTESVSVAISIPVSGVRITTETEDGVLTIDMAEYESDKYLSVEVLPLTAANRGYRLEFAPVDENSAEGKIEVSEDGLITPLDTGMVKVTAVTDDGGFRASIIVNVVSSKAIGADVSVYDRDVPSILFEVRDTDVPGMDGEVEVRGGRLGFEAAVRPSSVTADVTFSAEPYDEDGVADGFTIHPVTGFAEAKISGEYVVTVDLDPAVEGMERLRLLVRADCGDGFTVQGRESDAEVRVLPSAESATIYAESGSPVEVTSLAEGMTADPAELGGGRYAVRVEFESGMFSDGDTAVMELTSDGVTRKVTFVFAESVTEIFYKYVEPESKDYLQKTGSTASYAAVTEPSVPDGMTFRFETEGDAVRIAEFDSESGVCRAEALAEGTATLRVFTVTADGEETLADSRVIRVVDGFSSFVFTENASTWGIGGVLAVGGIASDGTSSQDYVLGFRAMRGTSAAETDDGEVLYTVSDPTLAEVKVTDGVPRLTAKGTGRVTVTAAWRYTEAFGDGMTASLVLDVVADGVNVDDYASLASATEAGKPVVLTTDIMLGENMIGEDGLPLPGADPHKYTHTFETTADWTYYANRGMSHPELSYVIEFKNDVYGNGRFLDADHITTFGPTVDSSLAVFKGPLDFVAIQGTAAVKAQDNVVFLVRTDGVTIDNVVLRGCSDESLYEDGLMELNNLNTVGTVLEIMADCRVINSRIMNGRTGVRAFGRYGVDAVVSDSDPVDAAAERIDAELESCIVSGAREFLVKLGTNRKVRGTYVRDGSSDKGYNVERMEPSLTANGNTYAPRNDDNLNDEAFNEQLVLTHLTLKNCALYNSGLFSIGFESCFAGPMLDGGVLNVGDDWDDIGGTSYAAVLRLSGEVRMYDWKSLDAVDSSTLIELPKGATGNTAFLSLNIKKMLSKVRDYGGEDYRNIIYTADGADYVHGGIAVYGGGKNYGIVDFADDFTSDPLKEYSVNLSVLAKGEEFDPKNPMNGSELYLQGTMLPFAAGTQDFRFFMYDASSDFGYAEQVKAISEGTAFDFVRPAER